MNRPGRSAVLVATAIAFGLLLSGCSSSPTPSPTPTASHTISTSPTSTPSASTSPTVATKAFAQYWVADTARGFRLYREFVRLEITPEPIMTALKSLIASTPKDSDYVSLWPKETKINSVVVVGNKATIDLTLGKMNVGSEAESMAIAQLVWTATAAQTSVKQIALTVDGKTVESIAGHVDATKPFRRGLTYEVLSPVWITVPEEGAQVSAQGFRLRGMASTFEANVAWKVFQNGKLVQQGSTTATEAAPAWTPWSVAIKGLLPGKYMFIAMEYSPKDGSLVAQDTKNVTLI
jgi:hypothetical protein